MAGKKLNQDQITKMGMYIRQGNYIPPRVQSNALLGKGEGRHIPGIGAVATALNVADQLHSAITGGLSESFKKKNFFNPGAVASGFWKGLKGDTHTSYADIMEQEGIHNPLLKGAVGFGMDVFLDPLTYVGLGKAGAGGLAKGTAELLAGKELGEQAVKASAETAAAKAAGVATATKAPVISKEAIATRAQQLMAENPTNWEFRYGLPTATPNTIAFKQPDVVTDMLHGITTRSTGETRPLVRALSRKAEQPHGLAEMSKVIQGSAQADFSDQNDVLKRIFSRISPDDRRYSYLRYEKPEKYDNKVLDLLEPNKFDRNAPDMEKLGFHTVDDVVNEVRGIHKKILEAELSQGKHVKLLPVESKTVMRDGVPFLEPRTVPWSEITNPQLKEEILAKGMAGHKLRRIVRNMDALDKVPGLSKTLSSQDRFINLNKLDIEAIPDAARPVVDIGEATLDRLRDTYKAQTQSDFVRQAIKKFGINTKEVPDATEIMAALEAADKDGNLRFRPVQPSEGQKVIHDDVARLAEFKDYHIPNDIANVLNATHKALTDETAGRALLQQYDRYLGHWKAWNSLASPGYHIRTTLGDFFQNAVAGVWDPQRYKQARDVLHEVKNTRVEDVLDAFRNPDLPLNALRDTRASNVFVNIGGAEMPGDRIYQYFHDTGAKSGELVTESLPNTIVPGVGKSAGGRISTLKGTGEKAGERIGANVNRYEAKVADLAVGRETWQRMANYINKFDSEVTSTLKAEAKARRMSTKNLGAIRDTLGPERVAKIEQTAAEAASKHTRKYNIDYGMLSSFEKDVMRRVVPFYSWFRLNAPQQLAQLASHPGVMTMAPKLMNGIEEVLGTQDASGDFMIPDWIRESLPMRVAMAGEAAHNPVSWAARKLTGVGGENAVFVPSLAGVLPMQDLETVLGPIAKAADVMQMRGGPTNWHNWEPAAWAGVHEGAKNAANMANPAVKGLFEAGTQKSSFTGGDITNFNDWALSQLGGPSRQLSKLSGISDAPSIRGLSSLLAGLPLQEVSQQRQKGEYQRRSDILTPEIRRMKLDLAKKRGIPSDSKRVEKISSQQIRQYKNYLRRAGRAVGSR